MTADVVAPIQLYRPGAQRTLARSMGYLRPYWGLVFGSYLLLLANTGITLAIPMLIRAIIDDGIATGDVAAIMSRIVVLMGLALLRGMFVFLSGRWTEVASQNVAFDLRNDLHDKLQSFSFSYHDRARTGQLLARAISDVDRVRFVTGRAVLRLVEVVTLTLGIAWDNPDITPENKLRYDACFSVSRPVEPEGDVGVQVIRGGKRAVYACEILDGDYYTPWWALVRDWLPFSGYQLDDAPPYQIIHIDSENADSGKHKVDICFPIKPL